MSTNFLVFIIAISSALALIYLIYTILVSLDSSTGKKKKELQISESGILEQAKMLYNQQKYGVVEKLAKKYLDVKPEHIDLRIVLAKALYKNDSIYEAIKECSFILSKHENNNDIRLILAKCYKKIEQYSKAIQELKKILEDEPENINILKELSDIYLETKQKAYAIEVLRKLEQLTDNSHDLVEIKTKLADLLIELENYPEAFDELNGILEIYPEDVDTNKKLIELYSKVQNYDAAIENCEKMLETNDNTSLGLWLLNNLTNFYYLDKNIEKAMEYAQQILKHPFADKLKTKKYIAKIMFENGKEQEAMEMLMQLQDQNNEDIEIKKLMIDNYVKNNNYVSALELYKQIMDLASVSDMNKVHLAISNLCVQWAKYLFSNQKYDEGFKIFKLAIQYNNENPLIYYELGMVNIEIKNYSEAIMHLKKAIQLAPNNADFYISLASCYEAIGDVFSQKDTLIQATKTDNTNTDAYYKLAMLYNNQHDNVNEIKTLEHIIELEPNHIDAKYQLALIKETQGDKENALELYKEIESINPDYKNIKENIEMLTSSIKADESQAL